MLLELVQKEVMDSTRAGVAYLKLSLEKGATPDQLAPSIDYLTNKVKEVQDIYEIVKFINANTRNWTIEQILNASDGWVSKQIAERYEKTFLAHLG